VHLVFNRKKQTWLLSVVEQMLLANCYSETRQEQPCPASELASAHTRVLLVRPPQRVW